MSPDRTDRTDHTDLLLRTLDPADTTIDPAVATRLDAALEHILTGSPVTSLSATPGATRPTAAAGRRRLRPRRLALLAGAATVMVGTAIAVPGLGGDAPAYASWTATPSTPSAQDTEGVAAACRSEVRNSMDVPLPTRASEWATVAERRGDYVTVLIRLASLDVSGFCVYEHEAGAATVEGPPLSSGATRGATAPPDSRALVEDGLIESGDGVSSQSTVTGRVGSEVSEVTLRSQGDAVTATVRDGQFIAWWPGRVFPSDPQAPPGDGSATTITYDLTLTDGTVLPDVAPHTPVGEVITETATA